MSDPAVPASVLVRLDRLERTNRRYRLSAAAFTLLVLGWVACSVAPEVKNQVAAERFVLLGPDGTEKAALELDSKGNAMLQLRGDATSAFLTANGPSLLLRGPDGRTGAFLGVDSKSTSRLELTSHRLLDGVRLTAHADGSSGLYVLDADGRLRGGLESFAQGGAGLNFRDVHGRVRGQVGLDAGGLPNVVLMDPNGARRLGMVLQGEGEPLLEVADELGTARAQLTTLFDGTPRLEFRRNDGGVILQVP
jgi:hypothetical protein